MCGTRFDKRLALVRRPSLIVLGAPTGLTCWRTGEYATASITVAQRSAAVSGVIAAEAASARREAISFGSGDPAFGGRDDCRRARTVRPSLSSEAISACHLPCSASTLACSPVLSSSASARDSSSFAPFSAATTTLRRSRRSTSLIPAIAASALSRHSALRRRGRRFSPTASRTFGGISSWPSALASVFCCSISLRRPAMPSRRTIRASGCFSSGSPRSTASRWVR